MANLDYHSPYLHSNLMFDFIESKISLRAFRLLLEFVVANLPWNQVPFRYSYFDMTLLFVFWMTNYPKNSTFTDVYRVRNSILQRIYRRVLRIIQPFINQHVSLPNHQQRSEIARRARTPAVWGDVNLIVDGSDMRCWLRRARGEQAKEWYSYKFKKAAFRIQFVVSFDSRFCWYSDPTPASRHDSRQLRESNIAQFLQPNERLLADTGYIGVRFCLTPHRRPRRGDFTPEQAAENQRIRNLRRRIEQCFGITKAKFCCLREPYRHEKVLFGKLVGSCLSLYNLTLGEPTSHLTKREFLSSLPREHLRQKRITNADDEEGPFEDAIFENDLDSDDDLDARETFVDFFYQSDDDHEPDDF
jgi:hypothetical protein